MSKIKFDNNPNPTPQHVKKFYFLDYFLILLQSCHQYDESTQIFINFLKLKDKELLGESKYRKLTSDLEEEVTERQVQRYWYTFEQVLIEAENYKIINRDKNKIIITNLGIECLKIAKKSKRDFYNRILVLMEAKYFAFYHLVKLCYRQNSSHNGLLIFPIYSPLKLGIKKGDLITNKDWIDFSYLLKDKIEDDIYNFIGQSLNLKSANETLIRNLHEDGIVSKNLSVKFDETKYNSIIGRLRKFWLNYLLQNIYKYQFSFDTFNLWVERGKQLGIVHSTEFYPGFNGRLVFPTSVIVKKNNSADLKKVYKYENGETLFVHLPKWKDKDVQDSFIRSLVDSYFDLKKNRRTIFIRLSDVREKVCYRMRIPSFLFNSFMEEAYNLNIKGETKIQISLEADRLPHETNAMYLKREPILVNGQYKNIIAINYKKK